MTVEIEDDASCKLLPEEIDSSLDQLISEPITLCTVDNSNVIELHQGEASIESILLALNRQSSSIKQLCVDTAKIAKRMSDKVHDVDTEKSRIQHALEQVEKSQIVIVRLISYFF